MINRCLLALLLSLFALPACADLLRADDLEVKNMSVEQFLDWHQSVARSASTKEFDALSGAQREQLASAQAELRAILDGKASMSDLDAEQKLRLFNAHERVLALVTEAEDGRLICTQKKRLGSHRHQLECRTVAQIRESREGSQIELRRSRTCNPGIAPCGGT